MAPKLFFKNFEAFKGLDTRSSNLTRPREFATDFTNYVINRRLSAEGRKGYKLVGNYEDYSSSDSLPPLYGIFSYRYKDIKGISKEDLIGVGRELAYVLKTGTIEITGPTGGKIYNIPSESGWTFDIRESGTTVGGSFPYDLGTGLESYTGNLTQYVRLGDLVDAIHGLANWTAIATPRAVVDGNQSGRGIAAAITVLNASPANTITVSTDDAVRIGIDQSGNFDFYDVVASSGTSLTLNEETNFNRSTFNVTDGAEIGIGAYPAVAMPMINGESSGPAITNTYEFLYWEAIYQYTDPSNGHSFFSAPFGPNSTQTFFQTVDGHNAVMKSVKSNVYIGLPRKPGDELNIDYTDTNQDVGSALSITGAQGVRDDIGGMVRYDGHMLAMAGLPTLPVSATATNSSGSLIAGSYRYAVNLKNIDFRGNVVRGPANITGIENPVSVAAPNDAITFAIVPLQNSAWKAAQWNLNSAVSSGPHTFISGNSGTYTIAVNAGHTLRVGDMATFTDRSTGLSTGFSTGECERYKVTAVTATSVTIDFDKTSNSIVCTGNVLSNNCTFEVWRSEADGTDLFFQVEVPATDSSATFSVVDGTADTSGRLWEGPFTGRNTKDAPPAMRIIESHQGIIVGGGSKDFPEKIYWSNSDSVENFPAATNELFLPATNAGSITAIASDNIDTLDVFREDSVTPIFGDFISGAISISEESIGDVGCPSPLGWVKARNNIYFISNKGPRTINSGKVGFFDDRLITYFLDNFYVQVDQEPSSIDNTKLVLKRSISVHDQENQRLIFYIPAEDMNDAGDADLLLYPVTSNSKVFVYDYANDLWSLFDMAHDMWGGAAFYKNEVYFLSAAGMQDGFSVPSTPDSISGALMKFSNDGILYDYIDNSTKITNTFKPQWEFLNEPSVDKQFQRIKTWQLNPERHVPFTLTVKTYKNFDEVNVDTNTTLDFQSSATQQDEKKLKLSKVQSLQVELSNDTVFENPLLSGYEMLITPVYKKEDLKKP